MGPTKREEVRKIIIDSKVSAGMGYMDVLVFQGVYLWCNRQTRTTETTETQILSSSWNPSKHQEAAQMVSMAGTISETSVPGRRKPRRIKSLAISWRQGGLCDFGIDNAWEKLSWLVGDLSQVNEGWSVWFSWGFSKLWLCSSHFCKCIFCWFVSSFCAVLVIGIGHMGNGTNQNLASIASAKELEEVHSANSLAWNSVTTALWRWKWSFQMWRRRRGRRRLRRPRPRQWQRQGQQEQQEQQQPTATATAIAIKLRATVAATTTWKKERWSYVPL